MKKLKGIIKLGGSKGVTIPPSIDVDVGDMGAIIPTSDGFEFKKLKLPKLKL